MPPSSNRLYCSVFLAFLTSCHYNCVAFSFICSPSSSSSFFVRKNKQQIFTLARLQGGEGGGGGGASSSGQHYHCSGHCHRKDVVVHSKNKNDEIDNNKAESSSRSSNNNSQSRRIFLVQSLTAPAVVAAAATIGGGTLFSLPARTGAAAFPFQKERRQLELCLVTVLRVSYWAESVGKVMENSAATSSVNRLKQSYLEARLGAKALLTGRVGGGAPYIVYSTLRTLELKDTLDDVAYYYNSLNNKKKDKNKNKTDKAAAQRRSAASSVSDICDNIIESLAAVVEFDGLETTQDPSPRSSLMLSMYTTDKATFVKRTLLERTVPACQELISLFGLDEQRFCEQYIRNNYGDEIPQSRREVVVVVPESPSL